MTTPSTSSWSESLQRQTREAIEQLPVTQDGQLHFKHARKGYALASHDDLCGGILTLHPIQAGNSVRFASVDVLLQAGWAID